MFVVHLCAFAEKGQPSKIIDEDYKPNENYAAAAKCEMDMGEKVHEFKQQMPPHSVVLCCVEYVCIYNIYNVIDENNCGI